MKTKKIIFGILIFAIATGSAFASLLLISDATYVKARLTLDGPIECFYIGSSQCDGNGTEICTVDINTRIGSGTTSRTYRDSGCTILSSTYTYYPMITSTTVFELVEPTF